jgi:hypothetical protein
MQLVQHVVAQLLGVLLSVARKLRREASEHVLVGNQWQSMAINGHQWQSMAINGNQW